MSLIESVWEVLGQVCFGLKCKIDPFTSCTVTTSSDSLQMEKYDALSFH